MTQEGDYIHDYCLRVKTTADKLRDASQHVTKSTLVLNLFRGVNKAYSNTTDIIAATNLSFSYAHDQLLIKELHLANKTKVEAATTLVARSAPSYGGSGCRSSSSGGCSSSSLGATTRRAGKSPMAAATIPTGATVEDNPTVDSANLSPPVAVVLHVARRPILVSSA